jgi:hypothetical protein
MTQQGEDRPTPYLSDPTPYPNGFSNLPGSNLPSSLPLSQLPGLGQTPQPTLNQHPNEPSVQQQHAVVHNQQQFYPYPPHAPSQQPIQSQLGTTSSSNLPGQSSSGQTPYPHPDVRPSVAHPQPSLNLPPQQGQQQPQQHIQPSQYQYTNGPNNAPVSPISPYMYTQPQYPQGHGTLIHSAPLPHNPALHGTMPQPHQYGPVYTNIPAPISPGLYPSPYGTQPQSPGQVFYPGHPNEATTNPINAPAGHGYGLRHTIPPSQPVYRPVDVVVKQTQQGQALFAPSSQAVGPVVATSAPQEKPSLFYEGPRSAPFFIKSRMNNLVLDARGTPDTIRQGTHLCVWPKKESDNSNQLWRWRQDGSIESFANPLLILDVELNNGNVFLNSPTGSASQKWTVTGHKFLVNRAHNHVLDVKGEVKDKATDVIVWQHHGKKNQQWTLEYLATPFYIRCRKNGLVLDLANETTTNGTKVILANKKDHDPDSQLWRWKGFNIESVKAGKVLDLDSRNGNVILWRCHNGTNQQWIFDGDRVVNKEEDKVLDCDGKEHPGVQLICGKPSTNSLQFFDLVS